MHWTIMQICCPKWHSRWTMHTLFRRSSLHRPSIHGGIPKDNNNNFICTLYIELSMKNAFQETYLINHKYKTKIQDVNVRRSRSSWEAFEMTYHQKITLCLHVRQPDKIFKILDVRQLSYFLDFEWIQTKKPNFLVLCYSDHQDVAKNSLQICNRSAVYAIIWRLKNIRFLRLPSEQDFQNTPCPAVPCFFLFFFLTFELISEK